MSFLHENEDVAREPEASFLRGGGAGVNGVSTYVQEFQREKVEKLRINFFRNE